MIDLDELRAEIRKMTKRTKLYSILREELTIQGHWKNLPRGNPRKGYSKMQYEMEKNNTYGSR